MRFVTCPLRPRRTGVALVVALLCLLRPGLAETAAVVPVGSFSDMKIAGDHCNGTAVDLWRHGQALVGLLHFCAGLVESKATTVIEEPAFDARTGALSFTARLSAGTDYLPGGREVASRDVWKFRGALSKDRLAGAFTKRDDANPRRRPRRVAARLQRRPGALEPFASLDEWRRWADKIAHPMQGN